ncbi:MAG: RNA polymerase factor sigma-54 [SAR86 cluster bacterium]|jgi:RNA polymerase sigma-54 factor|nr:RNA polymerase factor sigma-54 [SAR86 cluster bacterium]
MAIALIKELAQKQKVTLTPQLKKSIDLLQLSRYEIIQKINEEIEINPFLEKNEPEVNDYEGNDEFFSSEYQKEVVAQKSLRENLIDQLNDLNLTRDEFLISEAIISSLDDSGELVEGLDEIENLLDFRYSYKEIEKVLTDIIHLLDPAGIGFRSLKETIYIQLKRKNIDNQLLHISEIILFKSSGMNILDVKNKLLNDYDEASVENSIKLIKECDLAPGLSCSDDQYVVPDLIVMENSSKNLVNFINDQFPIIKVDEELVDSVQQALKKDPNESILNKIQNAKWLIRAVKKRNETVLKVGELICKKQNAFFQNEPLEIKPLSNKEISDELGLHPSTISRILRSKFIQTPRGVIPLKSLLISSVSKTRNVTPIQLMEIIKKIIDEEKSKLSDQDIALLLNKKGYSLARRTISKYRLKLNIPSSRKR